MNYSQKINISVLANVLFNATIECCFVMNNQANAVNIMMKEENDPVTEIDYQIQAKLTSYIRRTFPKLKIIGEQNSSDIESIIIKKQQHKMFQNKNQHQLQNDLLHLGSFQEDELCVWIDPLDCTRGFIAGLKYQCTILIGVTYMSKPILGIIAQPYKKINNAHQKYQFNPTVVIGSIKTELKCAYQYWVNKRMWEVYFPKKRNDQINLKILTSSRRGNEKQRHLLQKIKAQQIKTGGAGHKLLLLIRGEADALLFIDVMTSKWDSCAGQAILNSMGGLTIQPDLAKIVYSNCSIYTNPKGFISAMQQSVYNIIVDFLKENNF